MNTYLRRSVICLLLLFIDPIVDAPVRAHSTGAELRSPRVPSAKVFEDATSPRRQYGMNPEMQSTVETAFANAAKRTGIARSALVLVSAEAVTWPDGSLGCPRPGQTYTQAQVPGYRIRIQAGAKTLDYHANAHDYMILCPAWRPRSDRRN